MERVNTYSTNQIVTSAQLNAIQDRASGGEPSAVGNLTGATAGEKLVWWESATDVTAGKLVTVDEGSWKDYVVTWDLNVKGGANGEVGGVNDYAWDNGTVTHGMAYLGLGAEDGAGNQVTAGNPPVRASGTSWAGDLGGGKWLYVDAYDGNKLKFYNDTAGTLRTPALRVCGTETNLR